MLFRSWAKMAAAVGCVQQGPSMAGALGTVEVGCAASAGDHEVSWERAVQLASWPGQVMVVQTGMQSVRLRVWREKREETHNAGGDLASTWAVFCFNPLCLCKNQAVLCLLQLIGVIDNSLVKGRLREWLDRGVGLAGGEGTLVQTFGRFLGCCMGDVDELLVWGDVRMRLVADRSFAKAGARTIGP